MKLLTLLCLTLLMSLLHANDDQGFVDIETTSRFFNLSLESSSSSIISNEEPKSAVWYASGNVKDSNKACSMRIRYVPRLNDRAYKGYQPVVVEVRTRDSSFENPRSMLKTSHAFDWNPQLQESSLKLEGYDIDKNKGFHKKRSYTALINKTIEAEESVNFEVTVKGRPHFLSPTWTNTCIINGPFTQVH